MVSQRRVGLELEFPVVYTATGLGMGHRTAEKVWRSFAARDTSWTLVRETVSGSVTGVTRTVGGMDEHIDSDTGVCTVEVSLKPQDSVGAALQAAAPVLGLLQELLSEAGCTLLCTGIQPRTWFDSSHRTRKDWYVLLTRRWNLHHWNVPLASHQVSVDVSAREAVRVVNVLNGFAGVFAMLTACSPIAQGREHRWKEMRNWVWYERCRRVPAREARYTSNNIPDVPFADIGSYVEDFWDSHVYFLTDQKSSGYEVVGNTSFREFLLARDPVWTRKGDGQYVRMAPERDMLDKIHQYGWPAAKLHYSFGPGADLDGVRAALRERRIGPYFEEHAVRCYVENRSCGVAPEGEEGVAAALTLGLVERLDEAEALLRELAWNEWRRLWIHGSVRGLSDAPPKIHALTGELLHVAASGLRGRRAGEETHLEPLFHRWERRETPADHMISAFRAGGVGRLLSEFGRTA
ncbi:glutamate-cysteine ligase family protein [Streptomyces sp. NPDC091268]|uniref:glutamate-cysteine ligase family protein n=1 Tax=Streptomyces sp. NPDC091268 TaxID=3365979 RepID=UPI0038058172